MNRKLVLIVTLIGIMSATVLLISEAFDHGVSVLNNESQTLEYFFLRDRNFANTLVPVWNTSTWSKSEEFDGYSRFFSGGGADLYYNETGGKGWGGAVFLQGTHPHNVSRDFILGGINRQSAVLREYVTFKRTDEIPEKEFNLSAKVMVHERNYTTFGNRFTADSAVGVDLMFGFDDAEYDYEYWNVTSAIHADVILSRVFWDNGTKTLQHISNCSDNSGSIYDADFHLTLVRGKIESTDTWYEFNIDLGEVIETIFNITHVDTLHFRGVQVYIDGISSYTKATFSYVYTSLTSEKFTPVFQKGMSYATYANRSSPNQYNSTMSDESLRRMKNVGIEWVAVNVIWYQKNTTSTHIYPNISTFSPTNESVIRVIGNCHELGMKVMLKPMIDVEDVNGTWRAYIQPIPGWFGNYTAFVGFFAEIAEKYNAEMFCIGCELRSTSNSSYSNDWRNVVSEVRKRYQELITYAADWGSEYNEIEWWALLDYVGIDAYFPLSNKSDPAITDLNDTWGIIGDYLDGWYSSIGVPIIFTEIGYQAVDGANKEPWAWWLMFSGNLDLQEQADCYEATFLAFENRSWFYGMYWWYWQTNPDAGGSNNKDYTPQNKPAQGVLTHWYHVITEFPSTAILILVLMITTFTAIVVKKRKLVKSMYARNISQKRSF